MSAPAPQSNVYTYGVPVNETTSTIGGGPAAYGTRRARLLSLVAAGLYGTAAAASLIGGLTPTATLTIPSDSGSDLKTFSVYLYQQAATTRDGTTTTFRYTSDVCSYSIATAALACAGVGAAMNGLLTLLVLWRVLKQQQLPMSSSGLQRLLGLLALGFPVAALACAAKFYQNDCKGGPSLHSAGFKLDVGFAFLALAVAASVVALFVNIRSIRLTMTHSSWAAEASSSSFYAEGDTPVSLQQRAPLAKNAV